MTNDINDQKCGFIENGIIDVIRVENQIVCVVYESMDVFYILLIRQQ